MTASSALGGVVRVGRMSKDSRESAIAGHVAEHVVQHGVQHRRRRHYTSNDGDTKLATRKQSKVTRLHNQALTILALTETMPRDRCNSFAWCALVCWIMAELGIHIGWPGIERPRSRGLHQDGQHTCCQIAVISTHERLVPHPSLIQVRVFLLRQKKIMTAGS